MQRNVKIKMTKVCVGMMSIGKEAWGRMRNMRERERTIDEQNGNFVRNCGLIKKVRITWMNGGIWDYGSRKIYCKIDGGLVDFVYRIDGRIGQWFIDSTQEKYGRLDCWVVDFKAKRNAGINEG